MAAQHDGGDFDFDGWARLARDDPQAFEIKRAFVLECAIDAAPERSHHTLRRLQWKLDRIRETSATPLAACIRMQDLMWESVVGRDGLVDRLQLLPGSEPGGTARILTFPR